MTSRFNEDWRDPLIHFLSKSRTSASYYSLTLAPFQAWNTATTLAIHVVQHHHGPLHLLSFLAQCPAKSTYLKPPQPQRNLRQYFTQHSTHTSHVPRYPHPLALPDLPAHLDGTHNRPPLPRELRPGAAPLAGRQRNDA